MSAKHTPGPWAVSFDQPFEMSIRGPDGQKIQGISVHLDDCAHDYNPPVEANAAHIVRCVNMHDEMLAYLIELRGYVSSEELETLIAKAKGEQT